ncbi:hypothetical protein LINPERPRIM_LOCUS36375 [Linum perenne]
MLKEQTAALSSALQPGYFGIPGTSSSSKSSIKAHLLWWLFVSFGPTLYFRAGRPISWVEKRRV